jgi:hypothetical protein
MYAVFSMMTEANVVNPIEILARRKFMTLLARLH